MSSFKSKENLLDIIGPKTCTTSWAFAMLTLQDILYTGITEQVEALCNDNLQSQKKNQF